MKIVNELPPNYEKIKSKFDLEGKKPVFTYGDTIFNPHNGFISLDLIKHEETHEEQQNKIGIESWWDKYLEDPMFRFNQELQAYRNQYQFAKKVIKDRNILSKFVHAISRDLASSMYGSIVSFEEAQQKITL